MKSRYAFVVSVTPVAGQATRAPRDDDDAVGRSLHSTTTRVILDRITKLAATSSRALAALAHTQTDSMALESKAPQQQQQQQLQRASSLPRRLTFTTDSAQQQYQSAMKSVQEYLRTHMSPDQIELLGVNDCRARYYYDEIQQYLAHRVKQEQQQKQQAQQQPLRSHTTATLKCERSLPRRDSELLQDIDTFLDELDPALFELPVVDAVADKSASPPSTSRLQRSCSYIKEMQEEARSRGRYAPYGLKKPQYAAH